MGKAHTLHHSSHSDVPQAPGWPAEAEPSPGEGHAELSSAEQKKKGKAEQAVNAGDCMHASFRSACISLLQ